MSIFNVTNYDLESFSLETNPKTYFTSGSSGISGAQYVFSRRNKSIKDESVPGNGEYFDERQISNYGISNRSAKVKSYFDSVAGINPSNPYKVIRRITPTFKDQDNPEEFSGMDIKSLISGTLFPCYRSVMTNSEMSYTNYSCLNFVSSSTTPTNSALVYPNINDSLKITNQFTINFHINVRNKYSGVEFRPGTVLHLSSVYAISVVSGTQRDDSDLINSYGIQLQLSRSADISPSIASPGSSPSNLIWRFDDVLKYNSWHDVTLTWAGINSSTSKKIFNDATGSVYVDGSLAGTFTLPSSSLTSDYSAIAKPQLVIGNYYEGPGKMSDFFNETMSDIYGLVEITGTGTTQGRYPFTYATKFNHGGFFELHDINIKNTVLTGSVTTHEKRPESFSDYQFYLTPHFIEESRVRLAATDKLAGGMLVSAQDIANGKTSTPFNIMLSNGIGAHLINLENHLIDSAGSRAPFILNMSASVFQNSGFSPTTYNVNVNDYLYNNPGFGKCVSAANLLIMPCDDGTFSPNIGNVNITNYYVPAASVTANVASAQQTSSELWKFLGESYYFDKATLLMKLYGTTYGPTPITPGLWWAYTITADTNRATPAWLSYANSNYSSTRVDRKFPGSFSLKYADFDSNQIVLFDISNLFYGNYIQPKSFMLTDSALTGSGGRTSITIKDDGLGGLYRADSFTQHASFNNVGNIFYNEGVVILKNPSLYFVGKDSYEISFKGSRNIHVLKVESTAARGLVNKSNNPTYITDLRPSTDQIDDNDDFVYISGINYHDDNLNVVARVKLAQPIIKREFSKIAFRMKLDF